MQRPSLHIVSPGPPSSMELCLCLINGLGSIKQKRGSLETQGGDLILKTGRHVPDGTLEACMINSGEFWGYEDMTADQRNSYLVRAINLDLVCGNMRRIRKKAQELEMLPTRDGM